MAALLTEKAETEIVGRPEDFELARGHIVERDGHGAAAQADLPEQRIGGDVSAALSSSWIGRIL